jgi:DNA-binding beta-propeller fold protein YncE
VTRFALGGDGGWDYLISDSLSHRLFVARGDRVLVVDEETGKAAGEITGLEGAHGIALVPAEGDHVARGFATSGKSGEVVAFDPGSLKAIQKIKAGENPDAILYDPSSRRVFAFNGKSHSASAINVDSLAVEGAIPLDGKPEFAAADGSGHVFVNIEDKSELTVLDSKNLKVAATYPLKPCEEPTGLAMDRETQKLIVGCGNRMALIVDASSGKILQSFPVGDGVDAVAFDSKRKLALVSAGEGVLTILSESAMGFAATQSVTTLPSARTLAVDVATGRVFLPFAKLGAKKAGEKRPSVVAGSFGILVVGN